MSQASDGTLWFLPTHHVFHPALAQHLGEGAFSLGM